jgi:hypothetical protein
MGSNEIDLHRFDLAFVETNVSEKAYTGIESVNRGYSPHRSIYPVARCLHSKKSSRGNLHRLGSVGYCYNIFKLKRGAIEIDHVVYGKQIHFRSK